MKKYSTKIIKAYIEMNKDQIERVYCGIREDWHWTAEFVYDLGEYSSNYDWNDKHIEVAGITGISWGTPVMKVILKNGDMQIVDCYEDDGTSVPAEKIMRQKAMAILTGGMDDVIAGLNEEKYLSDKPGKYLEV